MDKTTTAFVYQAILEATKVHAIFPHLEWIDEHQLRVGLMQADPDQKQSASLKKELELLIVNSRYTLTPEDYMAALAENEKQTKISFGKTQKVAEIGLTIDEETEEKSFVVRSQGKTAEGFVLKKHEPLDPVLDYLKAIAFKQKKM